MAVSHRATAARYRGRAVPCAGYAPARAQAVWCGVEVLSRLELLKPPRVHRGGPRGPGRAAPASAGRRRRERTVWTDWCSRHRQLYPAGWPVPLVGFAGQRLHAMATQLCQQTAPSRSGTAHYAAGTGGKPAADSSVAIWLGGWRWGGQGETPGYDTQHRRVNLRFPNPSWMARRPSGPLRSGRGVRQTRPPRPSPPAFKADAIDSIAPRRRRGSSVAHVTQSGTGCATLSPDAVSAGGARRGVGGLRNRSTARGAGRGRHRGRRTCGRCACAWVPPTPT